MILLSIYVLNQMADHIIVGGAVCEGDRCRNRSLSMPLPPHPARARGRPLFEAWVLLLV